jgi:LacI family repressor for deo operon, udp, cdd, tsx, nupC, and nupG
VAEGLVVLVGNDDRDAGKLEAYLTMMLSQKPAGVVLVGGQVRDPAKSLRVFRAVDRLRQEGIPDAAVGRYELDIPHVAVDDAAAAECAVTHLIDMGHTRIAFVGGPLDSTTVEDRHDGYQAALNRAGIPVDDELVVQVPMSLEGGSRAADQLVACGAVFTAAFAATDEVAFGVVSGLRGCGLRVPEDVSIVGMDDVPMASHADPPMTTIRVPARELGRAAWHLLSAIRGGDAAPATRCVPFDLVVRSSTAPPGVADYAGSPSLDSQGTTARKDW